jgi:hypothetical protein
LVGNQRSFGFRSSGADHRNAKLICQIPQCVQKNSLLAVGAGQKGVNLVNDEQSRADVAEEIAYI